MKNRLVLIIVVVVCISMSIFLGLLVDLRRLYLEQKQVGQIASKAALLGAYELPIEKAAHQRALMYLQERMHNDESWEKAKIIIDAIDSTEVVSSVSKPETTLTIWIDTKYSRVPNIKDSINTANQIKVRIRKEVSTTFLRFVGINSIPVENSAEAQNTQELSLAIVTDISGSTTLKMLCRGCWIDDCNYIDCWTRYGAEDTGICAKGIVSNVILDNSNKDVTKNPRHMINGLEMAIIMLSSVSGRCSQPRANQVILLITDRSPTFMSNDGLQEHNCWEDNLWTGNTQTEEDQRAADCAIYYAKEAKEQGIVIYTFSLDELVNKELMTAIANETGGYHWWNLKFVELRQVLTQLLE